MTKIAPTKCARCGVILPNHVIAEMQKSLDNDPTIKGIDCLCPDCRYKGPVPRKAGEWVKHRTVEG